MDNGKRQWDALCATLDKSFNKYNIVLCKPRKICYLYVFQYHSNISFEKAGLQAHHSAMECMKEVLFFSDYMILKVPLLKWYHSSA